MRVMALPHSFGEARDVGRDKNVLHMPERRVGREGLVGCDIESCAGEASCSKRLHQRVLINQDAPPDVDKVRIRLEVCQPFGIHQVMRFGRDRHGQDNEVAFA